MLIGYREDLSRTTIQNFSNTGVIHLIVISGLHLGLIYALLSYFFNLFRRIKCFNVLKPLFIILLLWCFALVSGATAAITRSATMFTFIALGNLFNKPTNIYNNLSLSALLIFIINPFAFWDVGLQLSYAAVLSIVLFARFIKNWFYFKNKLLYYIWNLCSVSIAAQIFTLPLILYYFHQIPILFLFTNIIAVPIAALSLYMEILLLPLSFYPFLAKLIGNIIDHLLWLMNTYIENLNSLPFVVLGSLQINIIQVILLYGTSITIVYWLLYKKAKWLLIAQSFFICFLVIRTLHFYNKSFQKQIVVYNISNYTAIDVMEGYHYHFIGDSVLKEASFLQDFHLKPSRILSRVHEQQELYSIGFTNNCIFSANKRVLLLNKEINLTIVPTLKLKIDAIILSKNVKIKIVSLNNYFNCKQYVFDGSNSAYKVKEWLAEANSLKVSGYSVANSGAYQLKL